MKVCYVFFAWGRTQSFDTFCSRSVFGLVHIWFNSVDCRAARILGKMGATINEIQEASNTDIKMNQELWGCDSVCEQDSVYAC